MVVQWRNGLDAANAVEFISWGSRIKRRLYKNKKAQMGFDFLSKFHGEKDDCIKIKRQKLAFM